MANPPRMRNGSIEHLHLIEPLSVAVHHRHAETWAIRRALYEELHAKPDRLLLLAFNGAPAIGHGLGHVLAV